MSYTPGPLPEPACWTLKETLAAKQTTTTGRLWFTNPVNYGWTGLHTADQVRTHTAAEVARAVAAERERCAMLCDEISDEYQRRECFKYPELKTDAQEGASECAAAIRADPQRLQGTGE